jgi:hypothetical protein
MLLRLVLRQLGHIISRGFGLCMTGRSKQGERNMGLFFGTHHRKKLRRSLVEGGEAVRAAFQGSSGSGAGLDKAAVVPTYCSL